jgi:hypothetical protein
VFETSPERLLEVLTSSEFQQKQRHLDEAVVEAKFVEISRTEDRLEFELRSTEYERGMTGLNKKKTISTTTRAVWDLKARKSTWTYSTQAYDRFKLGGANRIEASGGTARYVSEVTVEVKVPLVGGKIEGMIIDGMTKGFQRHDDLVREFLKKSA